MEFKAITTQEEFDEAIKSRLERERKKFADYEEIKTKLADYESKDYEKQISELSEKLAKSTADADTIASLTERAEKAESNLARHKIASEMHIPSELIDRIHGNTEEEMRSDAETLSKFIGHSSKPAPLAQPDEDGANDAYKTMLANLRK